MSSVSSNTVTTVICTALGCLLAVFLTVQAIESPTGAVGTVALFAGLAGALLAAVNPTAGLYILSFECMYLDFIKRLAVYLGEATTETVVQVLVIVMITLCLFYAGIIARRAFGILRLQPWQVLTFLLMPIVGGVLFVAKFKEGVSAAGQFAANTGLYIGLLAAVPVLLRDDIAVKRFLKFLFWIGVPSAIWGIRQYFFGFSQLEWHYAETGLSPITSFHMFSARTPKPYGFMSSGHGYSVIATLFLLGCYWTATEKRARLTYGIATAIFAFAVGVSLSRSLLLIPLVCLLFIWTCQRKSRLAWAYSMMAMVILTGITFSQELLDSLPAVESELADNFQGRWQESTLRVATFSDRLRSWTRLKDPKTYTLFGRVIEGKLDRRPDETVTFADDDFSHDMISPILDYSGIVGLVVIGAGAIWLVARLHHIHFSIRDPRRRRMCTFLIGSQIPSVVTMMFGGFGLAVNPINLIFWSVLGAALALKLVDERENRLEEVGDSELWPGVPEMEARSIESRR